MTRYAAGLYVWGVNDTVPQIINTNTVWRSGQVVTLTDKVQVASGVTLTIEPGVQIIGNRNEIQVFGKLSANGSAAQSIEFDNVTLSLSSSYNEPGRLEISHALFSLGSFVPAGSGGYGSYSVTDSSFKGTGGFYIWYPTADSLFARNYFVDTPGLSIGVNLGNKVTIDSNVFAGYGTNYDIGDAAVGVWANYSKSVEVTRNTFLNTNRTALLVGNLGQTPASMVARDNFFNTTDAATIERMIVDRSDDLSRNSYINHSPILSAPANSMLNPVIGSVGTDNLVGTVGNDFIAGGAGADRLSGGAGDDFLDGGSGMDSAVYSGLFRSYAPSTANGVTSLHGGAAEGNDTLVSVESVTFKDGVLQFDPNAAFAQVLRAYDTVLGREPDPVGLDFYVDRMEDSGMSLIEVANDLAGSQEFQAATGGLSNSDFVDYVYNHALDRAPDAAGKAYYTQALDDGMSRGAFVVDLSESAEHRALTSAQVAEGFFNTDDTYQSIALLYDGFADRLPDIDGLTYYAERVKSGAMTLTDVTNDFATSAEFRNSIAGKDSGEIVDFIYQNTLDRAPDSIGRAFYKDQLDNGATAAGVLQDVALSMEHYNLFSSHIMQGIDYFG